MDRVSALQRVDEVREAVSKSRYEERNLSQQLEAAVRTAHFDAGVSQAELARRVGKHRNTIATWCRR